MTNRKRNDKSTSEFPPSLSVNSEDSGSHDDDAYDPLIPYHTSNSSKKRRNKKNDWTIPFDLQDLTSSSARDELITIASKRAGTTNSRSGRYIRPSWRDSFQNYVPGRNMCLFLGCIFVVVVFGGVKVISMMNREETRDYTSGYDRNEHSSLESVAGISLAEVDNWCLLEEGRNCECINPLKPMDKSNGWWNQAKDFNLGLVQNATSDLDVVLLGDSIIEQWNGRSMGVQMDNLDEIKGVFNNLFRKDHGGMIDGLALGITGDVTSNLLYRIQNGEMPQSLNPKVWWILIGTNDLGLMQCSEEVIFIGIIRVVEEILLRKPGSTVVINGILPRTNRKDGYLIPPPSEEHDTSSYINNQYINNTSLFDFWASILTINNSLKEFSKTHDNVYYIDSSDLFLVQLGNEKFQSEDKLLAKELMGDFVHPSVIGSRIWGNFIVEHTMSLTNNSVLDQI